VVSAPTMALVGEGRYPEAVVPLGSSPQFASMKENIANAVLQGMSRVNSQRGSASISIIPSDVKIDGERIGRIVFSAIEGELRRRGEALARTEQVAGLNSNISSLNSSVVSMQRSIRGIEKRLEVKS